jgi:hypothetical protein
LAALAAVGAAAGAAGVAGAEQAARRPPAAKVPTTSTERFSRIRRERTGEVRNVSLVFKAKLLDRVPWMRLRIDSF